MIYLKKGVDINKTSPEMFTALYAVNRAYGAYGYDCTITSGQDGVHGKDSLHPKGNAMDFRISNLKEGFAEKIMKYIKELIGGAGYDVVLENDHIHVEYDPKK